MPRLKTLAITLTTTLATTAVVAVAAPTPAAAAITCDTATSNGSTWYPGPSAGYTYDANFRSSHYVPWASTDVPQGAATLYNWDGYGHDAILVSTYPVSVNANSYILAIDAASGSFLGGIPIAQFHAGGLAVTGAWVYVSAGSTVRRYRASDVRNRIAAGGGFGILAAAGSQTIAAASFLSTDGWYVWAGHFNEIARGYMYQYSVLASGELSLMGSSIEVPTKTQGLIVTSTHFLFSTSYGRTNRSNIYSVRRGYASLDNARLKCFRAPSMSEGMTQWNGSAYVVYESGAGEYGVDPTTRNKIRNLHKASVSWLTSLS